MSIFKVLIFLSENFVKITEIKIQILVMTDFPSTSTIKNLENQHSRYNFHF
jgi:hypothetical protein